MYKKSKYNCQHFIAYIVIKHAKRILTLQFFTSSLHIHLTNIIKKLPINK